jgi:hypothetical protein
MQRAIYFFRQIATGGVKMQLRQSVKFFASFVLTAVVTAASMSAFAQGSATVLKPADMQKLIPSTVFYRGQVATTQQRNSGGIKFADGMYVLASLVDTSGYSTGIAAKYQAYLITEMPIKIGGHTLASGAYGVGFIAGDKFVVTDLGAHDVFTVATSNDAALQRPTPLQILADQSAGFRLYAGRKYVTLSR